MKEDKLEGRRLSREDLKVAIDTIRRSGGDVVSVTDGDWCGTTGRFPFPPKPGVVDVLNLVGHGWVLDWFPYGIPVIDHVHVRLRDRSLVQRY